jgi:hypothetical protein
MRIIIPSLEENQKMVSTRLFAINVYIIKNGEGVQVAQIDDVDIIECV